MRIALGLVVLATVARETAHADCSAEHKRARALRDTLASVGETTPDYRAMMIKKIQDAENTAATCEREAADAKRTNDARAAEKQREMEAEAKKEEADRFSIDEMRSQAEFLRVVWSAYACSYEKERDTVLNNPFATAEQKETQKRAELFLARIRATMKHGKLQQLSCRQDDVAKLSFCILEGSNPGCAQSEMALRIRAQKEIVAAVQLEATPAPLTPTQKHAKAYDEGMRLLQPQF